MVWGRLFAVLIGGLAITSSFSIWILIKSHWQGERIQVQSEHIAMLRELASEYNGAYKTEIQVSQRLQELLNNAHEQLANPPPSDEFGLLHTLCYVLERSGTTFESGSLLETWWLRNKGNFNEGKGG